MARVIVVGGGFGGLTAAKALAARGGKDLQITVIDRRNHHLFQPLLYQVATAGLSPAEIAVPIRAIIARYHKNVDVLMGEVTCIDTAEKTVTFEATKLSYDYLVLACGATHSYFGHNEWEEFAPGLKTIEQATEIRRRVLDAFELAERAKNPEEQKEYLTFAVVGGGPTGVELAGALGEISRHTLTRDFKHIDPSRTRIILIEAAPRILSAFDEELAQKATRDLEKLGVTVWTSSMVTNITAEGVQLGEEFVATRTVLWAAGVKPSPLSQALKVPLDRQGRVIVNEDLSIPGHPEVFVIGDQAAVKDAAGKLLPGQAPVAMQEGRAVARNILLMSRGERSLPFRFKDKGQMATIGRKAAILERGDLRLTGRMAWWAWLAVHIYYLIGFRNKIMVLFQWAWSYFFYRRGARLIVHKEWRSKAEEVCGKFVA